nr:redoxin domain-containing protein [Streptomyces sp. HG99]
MTLNAEPRAFFDARQQEIPAEIREIMNRAGQELAESGQADRALNVGAQAPRFSLPSAGGPTVTLDGLLAEGPVVLTFYRGAWCPYCNIALRALQQHHHDITARGARLVAVSPQVPDGSLSLSYKHELAFDVLSDLGSDTARQYGLAFDLPDDLAAVYDKLGFDLQHVNAGHPRTLPLPATYVIDRDATIRWAFVSTDYTTRAEPADILAALDSLGGGRHGYLHELRDQKASFRDIVKSVHTVRTASQIPSAIAAAWESALTAPHGPVWVEIPQDVLLAETTLPPVTALDATPRELLPRPELTAVAAQLLQHAERPAIIAGGGVVRSDASGKLLALAEKLDAPVVTTFGGKGAFPWEHPLSLQSWLEDRHTTDFLEDADVLLVVGSGLGELSSNYRTFAPRGRVIQIEADLGKLESNYPALGIHADARIALTALLETVEMGVPPVPGGLRGRRDPSADERVWAAWTTLSASMPLVAVHVVEGAGLAEAADAERGDRHVVDRGEEGGRVRVAVEQGHQRGGPVGGEDLVQEPPRFVVQAASAPHGAEQQVRAGHADHVGREPEPRQPVRRGQGLRHHGAHHGDGHRGFLRPPQRVGTGQDLASPPFPGGRVGGHAGKRLVHRPVVSRRCAELPSGFPRLPSSASRHRPWLPDGLWELIGLRASR